METSKILTGRLHPEDGSDWRETLGKRVSDNFAKMIFPVEKIFQGDVFLEIFEKYADHHDGRPS